MPDCRLRRCLVGSTVVVTLLAGGWLGVAAGGTAWAETVSTIDSADGAAVVATDVARPTRTPVSLPPTTLPAGSVAPGCTATGTSAAIDRDLQRAWMCVGGTVVEEFPITTALSQPDPGSYRVFSRSRFARSYEGGQYAMEYFVVFANGEQTGARVGFHSVPTCVTAIVSIGCSAGDYAQPLSSVGELAYRGQSHGCIRVLPDTAARLWDRLQIGTRVTVLN